METIHFFDDHVDIDTRPSNCPLCGHAIHPDPVGGRFIITPDGFATPSRWEIAFQCPRVECNRLFLARYENGAFDPGDTFTLQWVAPHAFRPPTVSPEVEQVSPAFARIFAQAAAAEHHRLDEIAGVGYRKALEFLVKDYCIDAHPSERDTIVGSSLGAVIKRFLQDPRLKDCAERAAWIGNDETHYQRVFQDRDVQDLKLLIALTTRWIEMEMLTRRFKNEMPGKGGEKT